MVYDVARGVTVLHGGFDGADQLGDTWEWNGITWLLRTENGPRPRESHAMVYDRARHVTLLFGGFDGNQRLGDTWEWDGNTWMLVTHPFVWGRSRHAMAYDSARDTIVIFGGYPLHYETWEFTGCDSDGDGFLDHLDACPQSDLNPSVIIDDCETGVPNRIDDTGCTMADQIAYCVDMARNHGAFVSCTAALTRSWREVGLITRQNMGHIQQCVARSRVPGLKMRRMSNILIP
ncbi:MAG: hypothetical protein IIC01_06730 [Planctomycetes bacterium]|nr:hypothetical protein [Planctomycetota bacterium]